MKFDFILVGKSSNTILSYLNTEGRRLVIITSDRHSSTAEAGRLSEKDGRLEVGCGEMITFSTYHSRGKESRNGFVSHH